MCDDVADRRLRLTMSTDKMRRVAMDLTTMYLGKKLKNPIVASASPLSRELWRNDVMNLKSVMSNCLTN